MCCSDTGCRVILPYNSNYYIRRDRNRIVSLTYTEGYKIFTPWQPGFCLASHPCTHRTASSKISLDLASSETLLLSPLLSRHIAPLSCTDSASLLVRYIEIGNACASLSVDTATCCCRMPTNVDTACCCHPQWLQPCSESG